MAQRKLVTASPPTGPAATLDVRDTPSRKRRNWEPTIAFWVFMAPILLGLLVFTYVPIVWGFLISLSDARGTVSISEFVGL